MASPEGRRARRLLQDRTEPLYRSALEDRDDEALVRWGVSLLEQSVAIRAASCFPPLTIGAMVPLEDAQAGGTVVTCEVVRYQDEEAVFRFPDGGCNAVGATVEEAAALSRRAQQRQEQEQELSALRVVELERWALEQSQRGSWHWIPSVSAGGQVEAKVVSYVDGWLTLAYSNPRTGKSQQKRFTPEKLRSLSTDPADVLEDELLALEETLNASSGSARLDYVINDFMISKKSCLYINPALPRRLRCAPDQSARPAESQGPALDPPVNSEGA